MTSFSTYFFTEPCIRLIRTCYTPPLFLSLTLFLSKNQNKREELATRGLYSSSSLSLSHTVSLKNQNKRGELATRGPYSSSSFSLSHCTLSQKSKQKRLHVGLVFCFPPPVFVCLISRLHVGIVHRCSTVAHLLTLFWNGHQAMYCLRKTKCII